MLSSAMLTLIFFEISIVVVAVFALVSILYKYIKTRSLRVLAVFLSLFLGIFGVITSLYSQIGYNLELPSAHLGYNMLIYACYCLLFVVWFYLSELFEIKNFFFTASVLIITILMLLLFSTCKVELALESGLIVPIVTGNFFPFITAVMAVVMGLEQFMAFKKFRKFISEGKDQYRVIMSAGISLIFLLVFMFTYFFTRITFFFVIAWLNVFTAMLFLYLSEAIPPDSEIMKSPLNFFRTRILFKLVIVLILMIVVSLEGLAVVSISISKKTLSNVIISNYSQVADDTIAMISRSGVKREAETKTLESIAKILVGTKIGSRASVFLISPSGNIYINRENSWVSLGVSRSRAVLDVFRNVKGGGEMNIFGEKVIAAYQRMPNVGWGIIVGQPVDYAYSSIKKMEGAALIFAFFWIGITLLIGVVFARTIEDPIKDMKKGILKIAEGDLNYKIHIDNIDEIGELANTFNDMTTQLKESQKSLLRSERLASLGYMAAGMAHEIKNALVPLMTLTELLSVAGKDEAFTAKFNELVPKEIHRINVISTDLLHYSRPADPLFEYLDINEIIKESARFLEIQAKKKNIIINIRLSPIHEVKADKQMIMEVFTNLILNAIEAMNGGEITLASREDLDNVMVEISDNGPGIPEENLRKIFVPFFTTKKEGTGMGLAITQRIMADHGGTIEVKSVHGSGTTFSLLLRKKS